MAGLGRSDLHGLEERLGAVEEWVAGRMRWKMVWLEGSMARVGGMRTWMTVTEGGAGKVKVLSEENERKAATEKGILC